MASAVAHGSRSPASRALCVVFAAVLALLSVCGAPAQGATVADLKNTIQSELQRINVGMTDFYSALSAPPTVQQQFCTTAIMNKGKGLSLTMEKLSTPYGVLATDFGLIIFKDNFVFGPSIKLIGASAWANGTLTTDVQYGNSILVPFKAETIVFVTGVITNKRGDANILPMAHYMMVGAYLCSYMHMDVGPLFSDTFKGVFAALA
ncbi:hypothetical protein LSCM1_04923 [Leishmania martiniquensis]|uniref:Uncharacterized protein n=1 Tax=Leishmania martiniquensis TaxID=1580590 RepID=A0A836HFV4_9TRYP|nr:hypothetical protein LSCM1_04923 [Leishmania martiniquensis]